MARKNRDELASWDEPKPEPVICPMCERVIPEDQRDEHHLVPKSKGGKNTVCLHRICHEQIHSIFTDAQLAKKFSTIEAILEHPAVQTFVTWVRNKPPGFSDTAKESRQSFHRGR
ncbi:MULTISPECIES: HNH endonuclease [Rhizobium/Agrobacterium group]|uniref:HNH endonuclease n=2 Tax=Rhizobium/Agrobacterium group TaxID=227290 RepID=B9JR51_ALLAM|nr:MULTISPECIES: HNH endonuclease [Rhizobium/Agrobacterium group]ACM38195.1 conserved hypothetical protein [Allorhizobium ampelinum S4]